MNFVPFITVWVTARNGITPDKGTNVYRSDMDEKIKKAVAAAHERQFCRTQKQISNAKAAARLLRNLSSEQLDALHHATQRAIKEEISFEEYKVIVDHIHAEESGEDSSPAKLTLIKLIEQKNLSDDDLYFLSAIMTGFLSVPPAALFQRLRSEHEPTAPDSPPYRPEGS